MALFLFPWAKNELRIWDQRYFSQVTRCDNKFPFHLNSPITRPLKIRTNSLRPIPLPHYPSPSNLILARCHHFSFSPHSTIPLHLLFLHLLNPNPSAYYSPKTPALNFGNSPIQPASPKTHYRPPLSSQFLPSYVAS